MRVCLCSWVAVWHCWTAAGPLAYPAVVVAGGGLPVCLVLLVMACPQLWVHHHHRCSSYVAVTSTALSFAGQHLLQLLSRELTAK
jgi:hypothetical protein